MRDPKELSDDELTREFLAATTAMLATVRPVTAPDVPQSMKNKAARLGVYDDAHIVATQEQTSRAKALAHEYLRRGL